MIGYKFGTQVTIGDLLSHRSGLPDHGGDTLEDLGFDRRQVLERLRLDGYDLPVVMATAESNSLKVRRARQLGVSAYLLKPFDLDHLVQIVDHLLAA